VDAEPDSSAPLAGETVPELQRLPDDAREMKKAVGP
jgi:hypothetical protein